MDKKIAEWGVLGCAGIADSAVIPGILSAENARLYAIAGRDPEKLAKFRDKHKPVKTYDSYEALLEDPAVDAVYIPLPNGLHCEWTIKAAEHKKHVLCEKPLGVSADEVVRMHEACRKNGVLLMEAFAYRHSPLVTRLKSMIGEGLIGKLKFIETHFSFPLYNESNIRFVGGLGGGATFDVGCYNLSITRHLAGSEPISVYAEGDIGKSTGVDETSCILMRFEGGLTAVSYCSFKCANKCGYYIVGEEGVIDAPVNFNQKGLVSIFLRSGGTTKEITLDCPDNYMLEVEQLGRCILGGERPLVSFEESYGNAAVIDKALAMIHGR